MDKRSFSVARLVTTGKLPNRLGQRQEFCSYALAKVCRECPDHVTVLQTSGGFLFDIQDLGEVITGEGSSVADFDAVVEATKEVTDTLLTKTVRRGLKEKADFLTLGLDVWSDTEGCPKHVEMVGTYDTQLGEFTGWTGKSYPLATQAQTLLYCSDLKTHQQTFGKTRVLVLGCHDLNIFSPRSRASTVRRSFKAKVTEAMQDICDKFRPEVVLQHPHYTDSANIWRVGWVGVQRFLPSVHTYASGIHYGNMFGEPVRTPLKSVLAGTKMGDIIDLVVPVRRSTR